MAQVTFSKFVNSSFGKTALISQELTIQRTVITGGKLNNSLNSSPFSAEELGLKEETREYKEKRNYLLKVPENATEEIINAKLKGFTLCKTLSNFPILTDEESYMISSGEGNKSYMDYAKSQVVRNSEGKIVLDRNNKFQYRRITLNPLGTEDRDLRTANIQDQFSNAELIAEYNASISVSQEA